jgi:hypothetical protein
VFLFRIGLSFVAPFLVILAACASSEAPPTRSNVSTAASVTSIEKPASVPEAAEPVAATTSLGRIERRADQPPRGVETRRLEDASCQNDVIVFETSKETIYVARSCAGFWDAEARTFFLDKEVAIVLEVTEARLRVFIETLDGALTEFTVAGIWME